MLIASHFMDLSKISWQSMFTKVTLDTTGARAYPLNQIK